MTTDCLGLVEKCPRRDRPNISQTVVVEKEEYWQCKQVKGQSFVVGLSTALFEWLKGNELEWVK